MKFFFKILIVFTIIQSSSSHSMQNVDIDYSKYERRAIEHFEPKNCSNWKKLVIAYPWLVEQGFFSALSSTLIVCASAGQASPLVGAAAGWLATFGMQIKDHPNKKNWLNTQILLARCLAHEEFKECVESEIIKYLEAQTKIKNNN